jgi:hypothetical protein
MGIRSGSARPEVQPTFLKPFALSFRMMDRLMLCNVLVEDLGCVFVMFERSPTLVLLPILF